jgi:general secretion pathway protein F|tara:strand:+ start:19654 stop:20850 length:1197 start_codon:yes stop_codon:yes gene_type:complete
MTTFRYQAYDTNEKKISGSINAENKLEVIENLKNLNLVPIKITETKAKISQLKISQASLSIFTKQLAALLAAGTTLEKSLELLINQTKNNKLSTLLNLIKDDVTSGVLLSESMKKFPKTFDRIYTSTVFAGETSASLPEVFNDISNYIDKEIKIKNQVTGALVYPLILFGVSIIVIYALLSLVLPQVAEEFISSNVSLPMITSILLSLSEIFPYILLGTFTIFGSMFILIKLNFLSHRLKIKLSIALLRFPIFGQIILFNQTARFCSSMFLMTKAGLNAIDSLSTSKDNFKNIYLRDELTTILARVNSGTSLSSAFQQSTIFPDVFIQLLSSGDSGSNISEMFGKIKVYLDEEVDTKRNFLLTLLQPLVILTMGVFVMLIVLAIMLPLLQMNNLVFNI